MKNTKDNIQIAIAARDWERNAAYRLRYGHVGNQANNLAPEGSGLYYDLQDRNGSVLLIAKNQEDAVVGSLSLVLRSEGPFILDDEYRWDELAQYCQSSPEIIKTHTGLITRGVVQYEYRGRKIFQKLMESLDRYAVELNCHHLVGVVLGSVHTQQKTASSKKDWLLSYGYQPYQQRIVGEMNAEFWVKNLQGN